MERQKRIGLVLCLLSLALHGCGGGTGMGGTSGSVETLTFEGWELYRTATQSGDFTAAEALFGNALSLDPGFGEAHNGLGWINLQRAGQEQDTEEQERLLLNAQTNFQRATNSDLENADAWAGLAGVELALDNYDSAIGAANQALQISTKYFSTHDNIDFKDLHLLLAESYLATGTITSDDVNDSANALAHVEQLSPGYVQFYADNNLEEGDLLLNIEELQGS
jgi:tetratricopeptide (TPR) repeat protein